MDRTQLLQHFDTLAETPEAVAKLRRLVLDFAIRGRLVPQNPKDDPAIQLIEQAKAVLAKERKKSNGHNNGEQEVLPFSLPKNWCWTRLDELGDTAPKNELDDRIEVGFSPMRLVNAKFGEPILFERKAWSEVRKGFTHFADGDVVVAKITPCFENGKSGVIRGAPNGFGAGTTELHVLRPVANCVLPEYALIFLKSSHFLVNGEAHMTGTAGQKRVPWDYFARTPFPLPPLAEQRRIVAKVEELLALCDELEARQTAAREHHTRLVRSALDHLTLPFRSSRRESAQTETKPGKNLSGLTSAAKRMEDDDFRRHAAFVLNAFPNLTSAPEDVPALRQAILSLAVQGHLVPQTAREAANGLLSKVQAYKKRLENEGVIKKPKPLPPIEGEELEHMIPDSWVWVRLGDICELITDGTHLTPKYTERGRMFLSAQNVKPFRFMPEKHRFVSEDDYQGYIKNRKPEFGDILLTRVGAGIGEAAVIDQRLDFAIYVSIALVRPTKGLIDPRYITLWLNSPHGTGKSRRFTYGIGMSQGNLNLGQIQKFAVPLPPLAEQQRIVTKVDELLRWCDALEARLDAAQTTATHLLDATLHRILNPIGQ